MGWQQHAVLSVVVVGILVALIFGGRASADQAVLSIQLVQVTNVTDRSFFVTWTTDQSVANGSILYGTSPTALISLVPEVMGPRGDVHRVFVQPAASPGTTIYFDVKSGSALDTNGGLHYRVMLGQSLGTYPSPATVTGRVLQSDGRTPAVGALVTVWAIDYSGLDGAPAGSTSTSLPLSALTDAAGNWSVLLETRTLDGSAFFKYTTNGTDQIKYSVDGGLLGHTSATIFPLSLSGTGQVIAPAVSLIGASTTATPTLTPTNGPIATNTPSASATPTATLTTTPTETVVLAETLTAIMPALPTSLAPASTDSATPLAPNPPFPAAVPTPMDALANSPTASALPVEPAVPNTLPGHAPGPKVIPTGTLFPRAVLTEGAGAWPDRSTRTATPSPTPGTFSPGSDSAGSGSDQIGPKLPMGIGLLLLIGMSFLGLGSVGVTIAVVEARREAVGR